MDSKKNPFAPGAGSDPPELAGREKIISDADVALSRAKAGRSARGQLLLGLRGVGKTVLLNRIATIAEGSGYRTLRLEAPEDQGLAEMLVPALRRELYHLSRAAGAKEIARRGLGVLRSFASAFKVKIGDVEVEIQAERGTADSGNLEADLPELLLIVGQAAKQVDAAVGLFVDEVQYLAQDELAALIASFHRLSQRGLPFLLFGAGLPQLAALAGEAKSYSERLFDYPGVGPLDPTAARNAIAAPVRREGVEITEEALALIVDKTKGYPYFLQEWVSHAWNVAQNSPITAADAEAATEGALRALDDGFFRVRLDRLTPREKDYVRAMAHLGEGPHRTGEIAQVLNTTTAGVGPLRDTLIKKGMIWSPRHGDQAFTVPMFGDFMLRSMPDWIPEQAWPGEAKKRRRDRKR